VPETVTENRESHPVGAYLREIRQTRGLTLDDAATVTRIGKNYLVAIEEGMFDRLPSAAYVKGFLRVYAGYLGLSGDEVVAMFERTVSSPVRGTEKAEPPLQIPKGHAHEGSRRSWLVPFVLLVVVIAVAYLFGEKEERRPPASRELPASVALAPSAAVQPNRSSAATAAVPAINAAGMPTAPPLPAGSDTAPQGIILKLKVNQDGLLTITIDDNLSQQYDLKAGDLIEWKAERVFALDLGNAGGVEAEFNGRPLNPFGEKGKPGRVVLKASGPTK
jgi:transcriptional regulator with XRE-family HTH domain